MAQRRMFSKKITETDRFIEMPLSSQALYFHLNMGADDEGFIDKAKTIQRTIGASDDDMKLLIAKGFLLPFESGVVVIRHWRIHNYIQADRFQNTIHHNEKAQLDYDDSKTANLKPLGACIQDVSKTETQVRLGKDRLGKDRLTTYTVEIVDYLNQQTGRNFKASNKTTQKLIQARFNDGHTLDDFKHVIVVKCHEWQAKADMAKYLRPETLFGNKFESYLNQPLPKHLQAKDDVDERLGF